MIWVGHKLHFGSDSPHLLQFEADSCSDNRAVCTELLRSLCTLPWSNEWTYYHWITNNSSTDNTNPFPLSSEDAGTSSSLDLLLSLFHHFPVSKHTMLLMNFVFTMIGLSIWPLPRSLNTPCWVKSIIGAFDVSLAACSLTSAGTRLHTSSKFIVGQYIASRFRWKCLIPTFPK